MVSPAFKKGASWFLIIVMMLQMTSCSYYQVKTLTRHDIGGTRGYDLGEKKWIIHAGDETYLLTEPRIDSSFLSGNLIKMDTAFYFYKENNTVKRYRSSEKEITKEVHVYIGEVNLQPPYAEIPLNKLEEISVINPNIGKSVAKAFFSTAGILFLLFLLLYGALILSYGA